MDEKEFDVENLFRFLNAHEGEFFVRVIMNEEGEFRGESNGCSDDTACGRSAYSVR